MSETCALQRVEVNYRGMYHPLLNAQRSIQESGHIYHSSPDKYAKCCQNHREADFFSGRCLINMQVAFHAQNGISSHQNKKENQAPGSWDLDCQLLGLLIDLFTSNCPFLLNIAVVFTCMFNKIQICFCSAVTSCQASRVETERFLNRWHSSTQGQQVLKYFKSGKWKKTTYG